jgi:fatty-acyl-CoA synthase
VALLNTNLTGRALAHGIEIVAPRHMIVAAELAGAFAGALPHLPLRPALWALGDADMDFARLDLDLARHAGARLDRSECRSVTIEDTALHIYTSGTTGLPKAAKVSHARVMMWSHWVAGMMDTRPADRMYDCLPMYHSVGGVVATGAMLVTGGSVVIRDKFSVRQFWDDVVRQDCTLVQYIGELCRYLTNAPPHPLETRHRLRLACGNGLRPDVWERFKSRFAIPQILEFYAATEGNLSLYNAEQKPGAIGRVPPFLAHRFPAAIVKFDLASGEPLRDEKGFCVPCAHDEVGEALGRIENRNPGSRFDGYTNVQESEKKILRDVFKPGDAWFRTGDLMRKDQQGYFYFVDRIGDTFRWKGENVATSEVREAIARCPGVVDAEVYGVAVPETDGRAGMAALVVTQGFDLDALRRHVTACLPGYARPVFLRICAELETTTTFKHKKAELVQAGCDPAATPDAIYFDDPQRQAFVPVDAALYQRIQGGHVRL